MNKINIYLFYLTYKYFIINFIIMSLFIIFLNLLEVSRVLPESNKNLFLFKLKKKRHIDREICNLIKKKGIFSNIS